MPAGKVCSRPGCPHRATYRGHCPHHAQQHEQQRGSRQQRGYDAAHDQLRREWAPRVAAGGVPCARCHEPITTGQAWALDHTDDRTGYLGPSHRRCNDQAGGRAAHNLPADQH